MTDLPGVYVEELNAFPNSIVAVQTSVPAFLGYTEMAPAADGPVKVFSLVEFEASFGGAPKTEFEFVAPDAVRVNPATRFLLHASVHLFFDNGGGACWIFSIGTYAEAQSAGKKKDEFVAALQGLEDVTEPAIVVAPDAVLLTEDDWSAVCQQLLAHCGKVQSRVAILDVYNGFLGPSGATGDVIESFRSSVGTDSLSYGAAYYPWLNTVYTDPRYLDSSSIAVRSLRMFGEALKASIAGLSNAQRAELVPLIAQLETGRTPVSGVGQQALLVNCTLYASVFNAVAEELNLMPPSGAMAGIYAQVDMTQGVFKAPANVTVTSVVSLTVLLTDAEQAALNVDALTGKSVNAIRSFTGRGALVWGARTLAGNDIDFRYINVRRTVIMIEQSIQTGLQAYVFEPNNSQTWASVRSSVSNFLLGLWKDGGLLGATPNDAFVVNVGLGTTMTQQDVLDGLMKVQVLVALLRPAEFIVLSFSQLMGTE